MSLAAEELVDRVRGLIGDRAGLRQQKMFGGVAFMLNGNMLVAPMKDGGLLVRTGPDHYETALRRPGASPMTMGQRTMSGFVQVSGDALEDDEALGSWIALAEEFVLTLPPK